MIPTPDEAKQFEAFVATWQTRLNLGDWRIERATKKASKGAMADVSFDPAARLASYRLGDFGGEAINAQTLERTCVHELLHVFLYDLIQTAQAKPSDEELEAVEHRCINVLERLLAP